ncbi:hypothetical protein FS749_004960 [Ceratobasidium sp. UAMH 11750]|nr:hypothetical protein FS749_004960 [Ceratobasidium sp. UAMH 11750]
MPRLSQAATNAASAESQQEVVMAAEGIENYELPKALVTRIAKSAIPENAKLQKEALHALLKGSTVFINYLAATAHDLSRARGHKSVGAADVIKAIETIEFNTDGLLKFLEADLEAFRAGTKKTKATGKAPAAGGSGKGKQKETAPVSGRKLKIVIAPIRDDEVSPGPGQTAEGVAGTDEEGREAEEDEEEVGEDVDELEDDVDEEPEEKVDTSMDTSGRIARMQFDMKGLVHHLTTPEDMRSATPEDML